jgi:hypothetical protein
VADKNSEAPGRVYTDLSDDEWAVLDAFEDPTYAVTAVRVGPRPRRALAYVWPGEALPQTWTAAVLDRDGLDAYLDRCRAWRIGFDDANS